MSAIDLVILGRLINGPKSAYDLKKELESQNIRNWVKISIPAIYQNVIKLHQKGLLEARTEKAGEMPEKTIYTINDAGIGHFHSLMNRYSQEVNSIYFDFSAFIENLDKIDRDTGFAMIQSLQEQFFKKRQHLKKEMERRSYLPVHSFAIMKLYYGMFKFLHEWAEELAGEYAKEKP